MKLNIKKLIGGGVQNLVSNLVLVSLQNKFYAGGGLLFRNSPRKESRCHLLNRHRERL